MNQQIILALIILSSVLVGLIAGLAIASFWALWRSMRFREQHAIPNILGTWRCQWFDDALETGEPKVEDTIEIKRWLNKGQFFAQGHQPQFLLSYPIWGEIDPSRVVTLEYKAARYPYEPNRGIAILQLNRDGKSMEGQWYGRRYSGGLGGGKVKFVRNLGSEQAA